MTIEPRSMARWVVGFDICRGEYPDHIRGAYPDADPDDPDIARGFLQEEAWEAWTCAVDSTERAIVEAIDDG